MSILASGLGSTPRLNMLLSIGGETLSAEARELPLASMASNAPFTSNARAWLQSCAKAQRSLIDSGAWAFFIDSPLLVKIDGARALESTPIEAFGAKTLKAAAFAGTRLSASFARALSQAAWPPLSNPLNKLAASLNAFGELASQHLSRLPLSPEPYCDNIMPGDGSPSRKSIVHLPASSAVFDRVDGMAELAPFWSQADIGLYVALHEAGHSAHHCFKRDDDDFFGSGQAGEPWREALRQLGFLDFHASVDAFTRIGATIFSESYADAFAAISMGAGSAEAISKRADEISQLRHAKIPAKLSCYSEGDVEHDTREALSELSAKIREEGACAPCDHEQIHQACLHSARVGLLRWVQSTSSHACGSLSWSLWRRAGALMELPENESAKVELIKLFDQNIQAMEKIPTLSHVATELKSEAQKNGVGPSNAGGAHMLLLAHRLAGSPIANLRGSKREAHATEDVLSLVQARILKKRSLATADMKTSLKR